MRLIAMRGVVLALVLAGCAEDPPPALGGDPEAGRLLLRQYGCSGCHRIPGVAGASANWGPPLDQVGRRVYLAGWIPNQPENMAAWIRDPRQFEPRTFMPNMQVTPAHARDMVAYLQSLR